MFDTEEFYRASCEAGIVKWPISVIRLNGSARGQLVDAACRVLDVWRGWADGAAGIVSYTDDVRHNTVTPIVRRRGDEYRAVMRQIYKADCERDDRQAVGLRPLPARMPALPLPHGGRFGAGAAHQAPGQRGAPVRLGCASRPK